MLALPCTRHCLRLPKTIDSRPHFEDNKCLNQHHHFRTNVNFPQRGKMFRLPPTIPPVSVSVSDRFFSEMPHFVGIVSHLLRLFHRDHRRCRHCRRRRRLPASLPSFVIVEFIDKLLVFFSLFCNWRPILWKIRFSFSCVYPKIWQINSGSLLNLYKSLI